jgi:hypothetical protein
MICWESAAVLSGIAVICLAQLARALAALSSGKNAGTALVVAHYYILKAAVQCVAANLVANVA